MTTSKVIPCAAAVGAVQGDLYDILFGRGVDGDLVIPAGAPVGHAGLYEYDELTIDPGAVLQVIPLASPDRPLIIKARKRITINGTITASGSATRRTGYGSLGTATYATGGGGGGGGGNGAAAGSDGAMGEPGNVDQFGLQLVGLLPPPTNGYTPATLPAAMGALGAGGVIGAPGTDGGDGSSGVPGGPILGQLEDLLSAYPMVAPAAGGGAGLPGTDGGAGGDGAGVGAGLGGAGGGAGAGGEGGGTIILCAPEIILAATGTIESRGAAGADGDPGVAGAPAGAGTNAGGGGGGGGGAGGQGGNGGLIALYYRTLTDLGATTVAAGAGGAGGVGGAGGAGDGAGQAGGAGGDGGLGPAGSTGVIVRRQILG